MKSLVDGFTRQLQEAILIGEAVKLSPVKDTPDNVLITGLGGSGIGGTIVSELVSDSCPVPVQVNKGYFLPAWVTAGTLVIACSYSGNTEETLQCLEEAVKRGAKVVCITSGGKMGELAKKNGLDIILIPGGSPPRACLGYSLVQLLFVFEHFGLISDEFRTQLLDAINLLEDEKDEIKAQAEKAAAKLKNKLPVIYSTSSNEGVAIRFRQQLNENAKILCWHHVIPEMNHNELVGWREKHKEIQVVIFRDPDEYERNDARIGINKTVIEAYASIIELWCKGNSPLAKVLYFIHLGDWTSCYLADLRGVDATEVRVIDFLKGELGKL